MKFRNNNFSRFTQNSEVNASELHENLKEMLPLYYLHKGCLHYVGKTFEFAKTLTNIFF